MNMKSFDSIGRRRNETQLLKNTRVHNARKVNSAKNPDGFLYIIKAKGQDLYKIGVSNKPDRRIRDVANVLPFEIETIYSNQFTDVYSLEQMIHDTFSINKVRREWFNSYPDDMSQLLELLEDIKNDPITN